MFEFRLDLSMNLTSKLKPNPSMFFPKMGLIHPSWISVRGELTYLVVPHCVVSHIVSLPIMQQILPSHNVIVCRPQKKKI